MVPSRSSTAPRPVAARRAAAVLSVAVLAVGAAGCGGDDAGADAAPSPPPAASVGTPEGLLRWMAANPDRAGLVVQPDRGAPTIAFGGRRVFPLASVRKVLVVGALADSPTSFSTRIPRRDVERWYAPGTDAGAHAQAELDPRRPTIRQVARAAITVSDNASADALLHRVGRRAVDRWARRHGMTAQQPIYPLYGEYASWAADPRWATRTPAERARLASARALTARTADVSRQPALDVQRRDADASVGGTPAEWATLMRDVGRRGDRDLVDTLDWPRRKDPEAARTYDRYLAKGGSLPGVITEASYLEPAGKPGAGVALFLRDLPPRVAASLQKTYVQQEVARRLVTDPAFAARARAILRGR